MKKILLLALLTASCATVPPVKPPVPTPPPERHIGVTVRSPEGLGLPDAHGALVPDTGDTSTADSNVDGRLAFTTTATGGGWLDIVEPNYRAYHERIILEENLDDVYLQTLRIDLPRLVPAGQFFRAGGDRFTVIEASDFNLYARYLDDGEAAVLPVILQRRDLGFNMLRVWTHMKLSQYGIGDLTPETHPDLYTRLPEFTQLLARNGLYVELTAYTGEPGRNDEQHYNRLVAAVQGETNVIIELVNENDQAGNALRDVNAFAPAPGIPSAHGSNGSQAWPVDAPWNYETFHTNGASEWWRKVGHNAMEIADARGRPVIANENTRFPDNDGSTNHAYDAAAGGALLTAGSCFHSVSGKNSTMWTGLELDAARAWARGAAAVPLACQAGSYVHRGDLEGPGILRVYQRGTDPRCIVTIRQ